MKTPDHIQICIPARKEAIAREFYGRILGLREIAKREELKSAGVLGFDRAGTELHIGVKSHSG
jgi:catechol 2,3-dioxygenase-like lactoylglutathione lyase family enzyme